jgi:hypothetical protein
MVVTRKQGPEKMTTTTTFTATNNSAATTRRWKWSGETEEPDYGRWEDDNNDDTYTKFHRKYANWYDTHANCGWSDNDDDDDDDTANHSNAYWNATAQLSTGYCNSPLAFASGEGTIIEPTAAAAAADDDYTTSSLLLQDPSPTSHNANDIPHVPFMNLTKEQRDKKSDQFKFGLCAHCDAGLDDESDFVCEPRGLGCSWVMACNACHDYFQQLRSSRVEHDGQGCN